MLKSKVGIIFIAMIFIVSIIFYPDMSSLGVTRGIMLSANIVIPSLFPFMFCVLMLIKSDLQIKNKTIKNFLYRFLGQNSYMFLVFLLSLIGGYPIGAKLINELYNKKIINQNSANIMLSFCVNAGPAFVVSVVGGVFNSRTIGVVLFFSHVMSSILIALICSVELKKYKCKTKKLIENNISFSEIFINSVNESSAGVISICSFVILFSTINSYLDYFFGEMPIIRYIASITEVVNALTKCNNVYIASFLLGFSGISIWCQIFALSSDFKVKKARFILFRIVHGSISALLTKILLVVFKIKISTFSNYEIKGVFLISNFSLFVSMIIMFVVFMVFLFSKNNSGKIINDMV